MAGKDIYSYAFADASIGCAVSSLMNKQDLTRAASSKDLKQCAAFLTDFGYDESPDLESGNVDAFLGREEQKLHDKISSTVQDPSELDFFTLPSDFLNIKVCLKSEALGRTPEEDELVATGSIDRKALLGMIRDRNYIFMPVEMKHAIEDASDLYGRSSDPQDIDIVVDKACYDLVSKVAAESGDDIVIGAVKAQIDVMNLEAFIRLKQMGKAWSFFERVFIEGGNVPQEFFIQNYEEPYSQLAEKLQPYGLKNVMAEGGQSLKDTGSFARLEKLADDTVMESYKKAKYIAFGLAPIAAYWYAKKTEIDNLRLIFTGIVIDSDRSSIIDMLREPYV